MPEKVYEIIALAARYWFSLLGLVIVWQSFIWLRRDRRDKHRRLRQLPDAGMIGEMVVIQGSDELPEGSTMPIPHEGVLGYLRTCDVVVPVEGVASCHCDFSFIPGKGLQVYPRGGNFALVDGEFVHKRKESKQHPMHHGSRLQVGEAVLRLRVFKGLEVERHSTVIPDDIPVPPQDWHDTTYIYHQVPALWDTAPMPPVQPPYDMGYGPYDPWQPDPACMPDDAFPAVQEYGSYDPYQPGVPCPPEHPQPYGYQPYETQTIDLPMNDPPAYRRRAPYGRRDEDGEA